jgi:hypothetical protein
MLRVAAYTWRYTMRIEYVLFDIIIRAASPGNYTVDVRGPFGHDGRSTFVPPFGNPIYQQLAKRLQELDTDEDGIVELGQFLFDSLFQSNIKDVYKLSQGGLKAGQGLRLRLDIDPTLTEIAELPWEFLYDPERGPLATLNMSVVRYFSQQAASAVLTMPLPIKVLISGAVTPPEPDVKRELNEISQALVELEQAGYVSLHIEEHLTRTKLQRLLRDGYMIWHFIGHGASSKDGKSGTLIFEDATGEAEPVSARELGIFLNSSEVRLIVLDACNSARLMLDPYRSIAPALIRAQIPAVVAMQFTVPQEATRAFAGEFYRSLAEGFPIDACVTEGRKAIIGTTGLRKPDWGIPVIYTRAPDGKLFERPAAPSATASATPANSGINVSVGSGNVLQDASSINISNVGNTTSEAKANTFDDGLDERIQALDAQVLMYGRQLSALQFKKASMGISTDVSTIIQIEDNERAQLAAMDQIVAFRNDRLNSLKRITGGARAALLADAQQALQKDTIRRKTMELRVLERKATEYPSRQTPYDGQIAALRGEIAKLESERRQLGG